MALDDGDSEATVVGDAAFTSPISGVDAGSRPSADDADEPGEATERADATEPAGGAEPTESAESPKRSLLHRVVSGLLTFGVVIAIFVFLVPKLTQGASLGEAVTYITPASVAVVLLLGLVNLATNWPPIVASLPGLRFAQAGVANTASAALSNTVPEGGAIATGLTFAMLRSWGFRLAAITLSIMTTGIWTNLVRYSLVAVALVVFALNQATPQALSAAAIVALGVGAAVVVFALILWREGAARGIGRVAGAMVNPVRRLFRKDPADVAGRVVRFRSEIIDLVRDRWWRLTWTMALSQLSAAFVLGVAVRMMGVPQSAVGWDQIMIAYGAAALASAVMPVPGGMGVAEASLMAVLTVGGGAAYADQLLAAVVLFRAATWLLPIPVGAGSYIFWRYNRSWRAEVPADVAERPAVATA